ncbi:MAG: AmmeMemoRadiSam system protein B [Dehalococcoidales bacterium]|nr:AmmeMemoRadiSam system protein B [Dehalococcoidales bacterium]
MIRNPVVAGQFYPGEAVQLRSMIKKMVEEHAPRTDVVGLIAPHAGYIYSGRVAGAVFSRITFRDTFILMGPNHTGNGVPLSIMTEGTWKTPLGDVEIDSELGEKILSSSKYLKEDFLAQQNEHSIEVHLPFLQYFRKDIKIVPIVLGFAGTNVYQAVGKEIARAVKELNKKVVIVASSDMTHYEPQEAARRKDNQAIQAILELNENELARRVQGLDISMCGLGPVVSLLAAAKIIGAGGAELVKYQTSGDITGDTSSVVGYAGIIIKEMSPITRLAKEAVESYVTTGKLPKVKELVPEMKDRAGVFVSIHKHGELRGCIGTFEPTQSNVAGEIMTNAVSSATDDPRFLPVSSEELGDLDYSVDVLTKPEPVADKTQLDPRKYGVIAQSGWRRGLLLPDLEGVETVDHQIDICRQKAGIAPDEPVNLHRFQVRRYK